MKNLLLSILVLSFPLLIVSQDLEISGPIKITDGTQGLGKVLTSDAAGLASWQVVSSSSPPSTSPIYYECVTICCNTWMTNNLDVDTYRNGDPIPKVEDSGEWSTLTTGAYCYYNNDSTTYAAIYGKLYNWFAVNDPRGLAPEGWHVPTDFEWTTAVDCLGGASVASGLMKEIGTSNWNSPNTNATNLCGFTAVPGGNRSCSGNFHLIGTDNILWSSTNVSSQAWWRRLTYNNDDVTRGGFSHCNGYSVRCIKD